MIAYPNADVAAARMATLVALVHDMPKGFVLLTTMNAATQRILARHVLKEPHFAPKSGGVWMRLHCVFLVRMGFTQAPTDGTR